MAIKFISNNRSKNTVNISKDCKMVFETSTLLYQLSTEKENRKSEKKWRRPKHCQQTWPDIYITPYSITEKNILFKCTCNELKRNHLPGAHGYGSASITIIVSTLHQALAVSTLWGYCPWGYWTPKMYSPNWDMP